MKKILFLLPLFIGFGCDEVSFREPQPKGKKSMSSVPKELHGKYILADEKEPVKDTIILDARGFRFGYFDPAEREKYKDEGFYKGGLGDSLVLKSYKDYYFWSFHESPEWKLRVIKRQLNGDLILMEPGKTNVDFKDYLKSLSSVVEVDSVEVNGEKLYQIDPTPRQLVRLIDRGYFHDILFRKLK
jgi:hypothetical protein